MRMARMGKVIVGIAILAGLSTTAFAQDKNVMKLSAQDYVDIQQLFVRAALHIDSKDDNGWACANLFAPDADYVSGSPKVVGRAQIAGGIRTGPGGSVLRHVTTNIVIDPAPGGARVRAYLTIVAVGTGSGGKPPAVSIEGMYDDFVVKMSEGWRIKHRNLNLNLAS